MAAEDEDYLPEALRIESEADMANRLAHNPSFQSLVRRASREIPAPTSDHTHAFIQRTQPGVPLTIRMCKTCTWIDWAAITQDLAVLVTNAIAPAQAMATNLRDTSAFQRSRQMDTIEPPEDVL